MGCRRREKKVGKFEETKTKDYFEETYISYTRTESNDELLKGSRIQKLRYPQMKELYDKVQESIKDSFKDFIPMGSETEQKLHSAIGIDH
ncbi:hypothetical protein Tco_1112967 [Tanacetum coccineum]|uniref:Uncharacterized protein n=1 Tax=Tanacetum coccineum TaxID=301880 RepID=A0ABQ5IR59_9ASTR